MPTFTTRGITATLFIAPLQETLSDENSLNEVPKQEKRMQRALDTGQKLRERPIGPVGPNGRRPGVLQFIGEENAPFNMVMASERLPDRVPTLPQSHSDQTIPSPATPATLLGGLPDSQLLAEMSASSDLAADQPYAGINFNQEPQAMILSVATSTSSHIKSMEPRRLSVKTPDLKIEVFFNGVLIGTEYINPRRANTAVSTNKQTLFSGLRIHRQSEKPWVYTPSDALGSDSQTAQGRWDVISAALKEEAYDRGIDSKGNVSPTSAFLSGLAEVPLSDNMLHFSKLAVIDVVVSTGSGKKSNSSYGFVMGPLRMASNKFKRIGESTSAETTASDGRRSTSPDIPLAQQTAEPPRKKAKNNNGRPSIARMDSPIASPEGRNKAQRAQKRTDLAMDLGAEPTGRLVQQIASSSLGDPPTRRRLAKDGTRGSPIKLKLNTMRGTAKSWVKHPLPLPSDGHTSNGQRDAAPSSDTSDGLPSRTQALTSRGAPTDAFTPEDALSNFQPPELCDGSAVSFAEAGLFRVSQRWRAGFFDEEEVVCGMRFVIV